MLSKFLVSDIFSLPDPIILRNQLHISEQPPPTSWLHSQKMEIVYGWTPDMILRTLSPGQLNRHKRFPTSENRP